jgi:cold shock CspA family protein|tara:strand:- start:340 stop:681 length:342 start_codon:yes stop_codon:yes gene_type:complete
MAEKTNIGKVLWFDHKKGWGFIRVINPDSEYLDKEVFVHFSTIECSSNFKKLYPGEVVSMKLQKNEEEEFKRTGKEFVTSNVCGLYGTDLFVDSKEYRYKVIKNREMNEVVEG